MTGLEAISSRVDVRRYLCENGLKLGELMPDWPGWDVPHICDMVNGGIYPTWPERLIERAEEHVKKYPTPLSFERSGHEVPSPAALIPPTA